MSFFDSLIQNWTDPSQIALRRGDQSLSYGALVDRIQRAVTWLQSRGLTQGDVVALQMPRAWSFLEIHLAALATGVATLPLNDRYTAAEVSYFLTDSGAKLAVVPEHIAAKLKMELPIVEAGRVRAALSACEPAALPPPTSPDTTAVLCYTSGTTGRPKGAVISHRNLLAMVSALHGAWRWQSSDVLLHALPLFHVHGLFVAQHGALFAGATTVWMKRFDAAHVLDCIERYRITVFMGVPTFYHRLLQLPQGGTADLSSMRLFTSGSAPLPAQNHSAFAKRFGFEVLERYGMTEIGIVLSNPYDRERRPGSVGFPLPNVKARIVVPDTDDDVSPGEVGELLIAGPSVFSGYLGRPDKTAEALAGDWMHTGDLAFRDEDQYIHLKGRRGDMVISGGLNVYPREVEATLLTHPQVAQVAVVGIPDPDLGERLVASVVATGSSLDAPALITWARERLAPYKCPKVIECVEQLPRNAMGKVQKTVLRTQWCRLLVRPATAADIDFLTASNAALAQETENLQLDIDRLRAGVTAVFTSDRGARYFIAERARQRVGQCMVTTEWSDWRCAQVWWLQSVWVTPGFRRQGVLAALYDVVRQAAEAEGAAGLRLYVDRSNQGAMRAYCALGMDGEHYRVFEDMFPASPTADLPA